MYRRLSIQKNLISKYLSFKKYDSHIFIKNLDSGASWFN